MDITLSFLAKSLDKHGITLVHITYPPLLTLYTKTNGGSMKACQLSSVWEILEIEFFYSLSTLILHWIKLENFVMQLKRQSVEAWQNEKNYKKENNTSENPIPRQEIFKPCEVRRSDQVTTFVLRAVFSLSFEAAVLLAKTAINHRFL